MDFYPESPNRISMKAAQNPYSFNINPSYPNTQGQYQQANFHKLSSSNHSYLSNPPVPNQYINIAQPSHARNFKTRLFNVDPRIEQAKLIEKEKYRQQLQVQIEEDARKKQMQKARQQAEDEKLQRQFYENIKIAAQPKNVKREQTNYFMMRTIKGKAKGSLDDSKASNVRRNNYLKNANSMQKINRTEQLLQKDNFKKTLYQSPKIIKRGGYHNKSWLDQNKNVDNPETITEGTHQNVGIPKDSKVLMKNSNLFIQQGYLKEQLQLEQHRIGLLLQFQENMLKKLDYFKKQILSTSKALDLHDELQKVKMSLRAKPLNMAKVHSLHVRQGVDDIMENSFYQLPLINRHQNIYEGSKQIKKRKEKQQKFESLQPLQKQVIALQDHKNYNDKNIAPEPNDN